MLLLHNWIHWSFICHIYELQAQATAHSDILNIPKGTVKSRVFRAREKLYDILCEEEVNTIE